MTGLFLSQEFLIERSQDFHRPVIEDRDVAGIVRTPVSESDHSSSRQRECAAAAGAQGGSKVIGNFLASTVEQAEPDFGIALVVVTDVDAAAVGSPLRVLYIAIEFVRDGVRPGAIAVHQIEPGGLVTLIAIVVAGVGDEFTVGRNGR